MASVANTLETQPEDSALADSAIAKLILTRHQ